MSHIGEKRKVEEDEEEQHAKALKGADDAEAEGDDAESESGDEESGSGEDEGDEGASGDDDEDELDEEDEEADPDELAGAHASGLCVCLMMACECQL